MTVRWFVRGDLDGFFGLFIDNLVQLLLIVTLCKGVCGLDDALVYGTILPAAALSILVGNVFYAWQARNLSLLTGRDDVTALPYGINTPSLIAYALLIMAPIYNEAKGGGATEAAAARLAWQAGLFACFLSGVMEVAGAFVGDWLRRHTPRAALLAALAGIAVTFISVGFVFQLFAAPAIALVPMMIILVAYAARIRLPLGIPAGLLAVLVGTGIAWWLHLQWGAGGFTPGWEVLHNWRDEVGLMLPSLHFADVFTVLEGGRGWKYLAVIVPMGLFNVIGSLQNLESAEAAGDRYDTMPSLLTNGVGTLAAAFLGSPFPTTIYIGHPGWKAMGARIGYSVLNGVVIAAMCLAGAMSLVEATVPIEVMLGILLWIGIIITAQAFQDTPRRHALAVALGLVPCLAAWAKVLVENALLAGGSNLRDGMEALRGMGVYVDGLLTLEAGFLISSMVLAAILVHVIDRRFVRAATWTAAAALLTIGGLIHAWEWTPVGGVTPVLEWGAAPWIAVSYAVTAVGLLVLAIFVRPDDDAGGRNDTAEVSVTAGETPPGA